MSLPDCVSGVNVHSHFLRVLVLAGVETCIESVSILPNNGFVEFASDVFSWCGLFVDDETDIDEPFSDDSEDIDKLFTDDIQDTEVSGNVVLSETLSSSLSTGWKRSE